MDLVARCRWCSFSWSIRVTTTTSAAAAITKANQGNRCPFCQSSQVVLKTERESQHTPT